MNPHTRVALLALVAAFLLTTDALGDPPRVHGDPASMTEKPALTFDPLPAHVGVKAPVSLTATRPETLARVRQALTIHPAVPVNVGYRDRCHYFIMPRYGWPKKTLMTLKLDRSHAQVTFTTDDDREIHVNLATQALWVWENGHPIRRFPVSTGASPDWVTPTGTYWIYKRIRDDHMVGGQPGTPEHWDVAHVPYAQYFNGPIAIHGAWWNHQFGRAISHGCIQLPTSHGPKGPTGDPPDARWLWDFAHIGTPVLVFGHTPKRPASAQEPRAFEPPSRPAPTSAKSAASYSP